MSISTVCSQVSLLGVPILEPFSGVFAPSMTLAENIGMCLNNGGSTRGGPGGADSKVPSMGATPFAALLKLVTRLSNGSGAGSPGRPGPWSWDRRWNSFAFLQLPHPVCDCLQILDDVDHHPLLLYQHAFQLDLVVLSM